MFIIVFVIEEKLQQGVVFYVSSCFCDISKKFTSFLNNKKQNHSNAVKYVSLLPVNFLYSIVGHKPKLIFIYKDRLPF